MDRIELAAAPPPKREPWVAFDPRGATSYSPVMNPDALLSDLIEQLRRGKVVAVVGAGISMGATNRAPCASWTGLLHDDVNRCAQVAAGLPKGWADRVHAEIDSGDVAGMTAAENKLGDRDDIAHLQFCWQL